MERDQMSSCSVLLYTIIPTMKYDLKRLWKAVPVMRYWQTSHQTCKSLTSGPSTLWTLPSSQIYLQRGTSYSFTMGITAARLAVCIMASLGVKLTGALISQLINYLCICLYFWMILSILINIITILLFTNYYYYCLQLLLLLILFSLSLLLYYYYYYCYHCYQYH